MSPYNTQNYENLVFLWFSGIALSRHFILRIRVLHPTILPLGEILMSGNQKVESRIKIVHVFKCLRLFNCQLFIFLVEIQGPRRLYTGCRRLIGIDEDYHYYVDTETNQFVLL